jgi:long-chain acyl-CoA synthetase
MKMSEMLNKSTQLKPDAIACIAGNISLSYSDLAGNVALFSDELKQLGCQKGVKIGVALGNSIEYIISMFSIWATDAILIPLHKSMAIPEIDRILLESNTNIIITHPQYINTLRASIHRNNVSFIGILYREDSGIRSFMETSFTVNIDEENRDVAIMIPTSGSTGNPKIVMHREASLLLNMQQFQQAMNFSGPHRVLLAVKFHHIFCICAQILTHISRNDTLIFDDEPFFVDNFLKKVQHQNISITALIPAMFIMIATYPFISQHKTLPLKYIICAGAKTPQQHIDKVKTIIPGLTFINAYGLTEAGPRVSLTRPGEYYKNYESAGKCIPGVQVKILDKDGKELTDGQVGEIYVKSDGIMKGYCNRPQLTRETIINGWLRTGDMGKIDIEGNLVVLGRSKEIINSGGDNIYPAEIEECIMKHDAVDKVAVVGKPDDIFQEIPCAFIVLKKDSTLTKLDIIKWCKSRLSAYKIPRDVIFIEEMPLLSTFKYNKKELKNRFYNSCTKILL